jgi:MATE family multidrug resistance protein
MVVSHACDTVMTFTDRVFLSRLGPDEMNAAMSGGLTSFMMMTFFMGLIGYTTALVAQYLGAGRRTAAPWPPPRP